MTETNAELFQEYSWAHVGTGTACPRCLALALEGRIRDETVMPLHPEPAHRPLARDGSGPCCADCAFAEGPAVRSASPGFVPGRIAVGNCRQEQLRLPGAPLGLAHYGLPRNEPGDFEKHLAWLDLAVYPHTRDAEGDPRGPR